MKFYHLINLLLCFTALTAVPGAAGPLRIVLLSETTIQGDTIFFSHLLPESAAPNLRVRGANLSLGSAPAIGFSRRIARDALNAALLDGNFTLEEFIVPESVLVRREGHVLTLNDVSQAINTRLASSGDGATRQTRPADLHLDLPAVSFTGDPGLSVTEMAYDRLLHSTRFRLTSRTNPKIPPFYAWLSSASDKSQTPFHAMSRLTPVASASVVEGVASSRIILVEPSRMASLFLHSSSLSTMIRVRPLQPGQSGETIRVRLPRNGKTLRARVVATDFLEAVF